MDVDWPTEFGAWLDRIEAAARAGDQRSRATLVFTARALDQLRNLREPGAGTVVVALFAADKARLGDVFYDGVAARADPLIDQWKRETGYEDKPPQEEP